MKKLLLAATIMTSALFHQPAHAQESKTTLQLYTLNCGSIHVSDLNVFSDTDQYIGKDKTLNVGCYLIKHNNDWLLWDTGIPSALAQKPEGMTNGVFHLSVAKTLTEQLATIGLKPEDINYVGISHAHFDHTSNANLFTNATLIIQDTEYNFLKNTPEAAKAYNMPPENISYFLADEHKGQLHTIKGDDDIFKDGTIKAISLPGHTPGHMALLVNLEKTGPVILSGDQWHFTQNHESNGVPTFNYDRADTLASSDKLDHLIKNRGAKLIIQHEVNDNKDLPKPPAFLD
tara:strand:- start:1415 stop:2278 length:864 start_codon:yes stop_codon:yes gene_type:complete